MSICDVKTSIFQHFSIFGLVVEANYFSKLNDLWNMGFYQRLNLSRIQNFTILSKFLSKQVNTSIDIRHDCKTYNHIWGSSLICYGKSNKYEENARQSYASVSNQGT